jgi:membrane-bound serine protease (ClpP class)
MPLPILLLAHPAAPYALLVATVVALLRAAYAPARFVPAFAGVAALLLAALASLAAPPPTAGLLLLALVVALLNVEFALATYGCAGAGGLAAALCGSWLALDDAAPPGFPGATVRAAMALIGTLAIAATVLHGWRRRTLPRDD